MTCAKRIVTCVLISNTGEVLKRQNTCLNPQPVCPRLPGEGYLKCSTICNQQGHAEIQALKAARLTGFPLEGATAHLYGHDYICKDCAEGLKENGVTTLQVHL